MGFVSFLQWLIYKNGPGEFLLYYDPDIGFFLQPDPAMQYPSPYLYVGGNPVNRIDPTGMFDYGDFDVAGAWVISDHGSVSSTGWTGPSWYSGSGSGTGGAGGGAGGGGGGYSDVQDWGLWGDPVVVTAERLSTGPIGVFTPDIPETGIFEMGLDLSRYTSGGGGSPGSGEMGVSGRFNIEFEIQRAKFNSNVRDLKNYMDLFEHATEPWHKAAVITSMLTVGVITAGVGVYTMGAGILSIPTTGPAGGIVAGAGFVVTLTGIGIFAVGVDLIPGVNILPYDFRFRK